MRQQVQSNLPLIVDLNARFWHSSTLSGSSTFSTSHGTERAAQGSDAGSFLSASHSFVGMVWAALGPAIQGLTCHSNSARLSLRRSSATGATRPPHQPPVHAIARVSPTARVNGRR
jgi:hypothetical protein